MAAEDSRKLALPQTADAYKIALPADFKAPAGVEARIDDANPLWPQARAWALKHGVSQDALSEAIGLVMGDRIGTEAQIKAAREAEIAKLGATGPARIDALNRFFGAYLGPEAGAAVMARVFTAADVAVMEKLIGKIGSGSSSFTASGREPSQGSKVSDAEFTRMSNAQRLDYARQHDQRQFGN